MVLILPSLIRDKKNLFPCVILWVFVFLVTEHHTKLYAPRDYQSDKAFLQASTKSNPEYLAHSLEEEIDNSEVSIEIIEDEAADS